MKYLILLILCSCTPALKPCLTVVENSAPISLDPNLKYHDKITVTDEFYLDTCCTVIEKKYVGYTMTCNGYPHNRLYTFGELKFKKGCY